MERLLKMLACLTPLEMFFIAFLFPTPKLQNSLWCINHGGLTVCLVFERFFPKLIVKSFCLWSIYLMNRYLYSVKRLLFFKQGLFFNKQVVSEILISGRNQLKFKFDSRFLFFRIRACFR